MINALKIPYVKVVLRMYCIDRAGVPESHDAHAFDCLYD